jgi:glutamate racemase
LIYVADSARAPYGTKSPNDIIDFSRQITRYLISHQVKAIAIACNTATTAAIQQLRREFPHMIFIGTEPAIKPGSYQSRTNKIGLLATQSTLDSRRLKSLLSRYARNITIYSNPCIGLVERIEQNQLNHSSTKKLLQEILIPLKEQGIDQLILGCTHYPLLLSQIQQILGPTINVIDPNIAIAGHLKHLLQTHHLLSTNTPKHLFYTTADIHEFEHQIFEIVHLQELPRKISLL